MGKGEKALWPTYIGEIKVKMEEKVAGMHWRMFVGSAKRAKRTMEGLLWDAGRPLRESGLFDER